MTIWFTSDTHFGHRSILNFSRRPFPTIEEHDEALIQRWNAVVQPGDTVFHLGDFSYRATAGLATTVFNRLNGLKHLIIGNHDDEEVLALGWADAPELMREIRIDKTKVVLCHYPIRSWNGLYNGAMHLYGHEHGRVDDWSNCLDVGVDRWSWSPVNFDQIRGRAIGLPPLFPQARRAALR